MTSYKLLVIKKLFSVHETRPRVDISNYRDNSLILHQSSEAFLYR